MNLILNESYNCNDKLTSADGSYIKINGKKFLDLSNCAGALLLGHNSKIFKRSLNELKEKKISNYAAPNLYTVKFAKMLSKVFPEFKSFIFCNSGSEAIQKTLRIVNALKKEKKIISVQGSWHGSVDQFLFTKLNGINKPISDGINENLKKNLIFIPYNDILNSKEILNKNKNKIAAIFVEPVPGCLPNEDCKEYLKFLDKFSKKNKILLIFDEMITGLRTLEGSVYKKYNIKPSIVTLGKAIGGGLPVGIIGVNKKISNMLQKKVKVFFGGTYSGNSITSIFGTEIVKYIYKNKKVIKKLNLNAKKIQTQVNLFIKKENIKAKIFRFESVLRIVYTNKKVKNRIQRDFLESQNNNKIQKFKNYIYENKIYIPSSGLIFISAKMNNKDINKIINSFKDGLKKYFS